MLKTIHFEYIYSRYNNEIKYSMLDYNFIFAEIDATVFILTSMIITTHI